MQVLQLKPRHAWAFLMRGAGRFELGDYEGSLAYLDEVIRLDRRVPQF